MQTSESGPKTHYQFEAKTPAPPRVSWWLRMTSTGWNKPQETIEQREKVRRSRLTSWILLGILLILVLFIPATLSDPASAISVVAAFVGIFIAILLNRRGFVTAAGVLLVILACGATVGVIMGSPDGKIHLVYLPAYDFLVVPVILGASILPRSSAFIIAAVNIGLIYGDLFLQSKSQDLIDAINAYGSPGMGMMVITGRPVAILVITAVLAYLWVRGMDQAVRRADRAEELRAIELQFAELEAERTAQVEEFVQETINAIGALANGQEGLMLLPASHPWQPQATFINTQLKQFYKLKQANRGGNEQLYLAAEMLLRVLQRINSAQATTSGLDPKQFSTPVPVINEIAKYLYFMLQGKQAPIAPGGWHTQADKRL